MQAYYFHDIDGIRKLDRERSGIRKLDREKWPSFFNGNIYHQPPSFDPAFISFPMIKKGDPPLAGVKKSFPFRWSCVWLSMAGRLSSSASFPHHPLVKMKIELRQKPGCCGLECHGLFDSKSKQSALLGERCWKNHLPISSQSLGRVNRTEKEEGGARRSV